MTWKSLPSVSSISYNLGINLSLGKEDEGGGEVEWVRASRNEKMENFELRPCR